MNLARLPREFVLAAACCRWPPGKARDDAVRAAAREIVAWDRFLATVTRHRIPALAHAALQAAGIELPAPIADELAKRAQRIAHRNAVMAAETLRLQSAFDATAIPAVNLKGVALAQLAYGSTALKHARDIDILVPADCAETALRLIKRDGYTRVSPAGPLTAEQRRAIVSYGKEAEFVHASTNIRLEVQWRLAINPLLLKGLDARAATQLVSLGEGRAIRTLAQEPLFAYLCVHGACHSWSRLKWLADLNALLAPLNDTDIERLYRYAAGVGAGLCAGQALLLCHRLLALPLSATLRVELEASSRVERLAGIAMQALTAPIAQTDRDVGAVARNTVLPFLLGQGWAYIAAQFRIAAVGRDDAIRLMLPPALYFLYPLLRLPLWLWRRAAAAKPRR